MYYEYKLPINLFLILEKSSIVMWKSKTLHSNHFIFFIDKNWNYLLNIILKNEIFLSESFLIDNSAIDTISYTKKSNFLNFFWKNNKLLTFYTYYFYALKLKLTYFLIINNYLNNNFNYISSVDWIYKNAGWVERETSEMYGIHFINKRDTRKLLLDYSKNEYPLLKDFPSEGLQEVFFNVFNSQVSINRSEVIEL